jgi:hypothetical protein
MLGVPLGSDKFVSKFVGDKLSRKMEAVASRVADFYDTQAAFFLLRTSFTIVRATHFMRTTPLVQWSEQASKFDSSVRDVAENILGYRFPDHTYRQSCLTPRLGGMGLRKVVDHAEIAFAASWTESRNTCGEKWVERADVRGEVPSQKRGSYLKDQSILRELIDGASSTRERKRIERLQLEHAGAWVAAVPSTLDGMDCVMRPQCFGVAVAIRLGLPVVKQEGRCSSCEQVFDIMGDHHSCCSKTSPTQQASD